MITAVTVLLDDKGALQRCLGEAERLQATYALADEAADELAGATDVNGMAAHRLMLRAHFISYMRLTDAEDAKCVLRMLLAEIEPPPQTEIPDVPLAA